MKFKVKVEGLKELDAALSEMKKAGAKAVSVRALKRAADPIAKDAKSRVHTATGRLRDSIGVSASLTTRQRKAAGGGAKAQAGGGYRSAAKDFVEVHVGPMTGGPFVKAPTPAGLMEEFGTHNQPPHPFMRPAWDSGKDQALADIKDELATEIEKTRQRAARKALKA